LDHAGHVGLRRLLHPRHFGLGWTHALRVRAAEKLETKESTSQKDDAKDN
jgi:hypothetical protein